MTRPPTAASGTAHAATARVADTRTLLMDTAERLFAEVGISAVSNRQISEAARQGNNTAVSYHFGSKEALLRAIVARHQADIESRRTTLLASVSGSDDVRDWVRCLVEPTSAHLAALGTPTSYARFSAQLLATPEHRDVLIGEALEAPSLHEVLAGLDRCLPDMPAPVREQRDQMSRQLIVYGYAEREFGVAHRSARAVRASWTEFAVGLVDAMVGMWTAPWTAGAPHRADGASR